MPESLSNLKPALETALDALLDAWFPRVIDEINGGFNCDFDYRWRPGGPNHRMLEFQARTLRFVCRAARTRPQLTAYADHGFNFLSDVMWDKEYGGFYRMVDQQGQPLESSMKHGHGTAYAISACAFYYQLTGEQRALDLALQTLDWVEEFAHDSEFGGYYSFFLRDGTKILDPAMLPNKNYPFDPLGNPVGFKESNTNQDLTEALSHMHAVSAEPLVLKRLNEMIAIIMERMLVSPGALHLVFTPDWTPIPQITVYAMCMQVSRILIEASRAAGDGKVSADVMETASMVVDQVLKVAWDHENGGIHQAGWAFGPAIIEKHEVFVPDKVWWGQAESLRTLITMAEERPDAGYGDKAVNQWRYIDRYVINHRHGGWKEKGRDSERFDPKADAAFIWKDPCHEGLALISAIETCGRIQNQCRTRPADSSG
jgi:mannobiose 2-epimerase